ncbi:branched-chain amino acid ABC transporter permease [Haloarcula marismortui]|uniref:Branched-chain amino acid ABC transporter permease n=1 Tax=Haloarcula marismortui ATCC 33799 TaxID=662475 RepID=M0JRD5_9EURY|nr:branched-chain amino acid ABC transporter permease [Haloarcula californiae]EMA11707.1 branched-chain amino acid ABC transporter permease [Haloarcula californiae ATCC 33799]
MPERVDRDGTPAYRVLGVEVTRREAAFLVLGVVFLFVIPDIASLSDSLQLSVIHQGLLFGFAAVGLNLLLRHTKLTSFGHAAFFGTGAYATAVLARYAGVQSVGLLLLGAIAAATVMAAIIGVLSLRHTGLYFALLTLAFGQLLYAIALGQSALGGSDGLPVRPGPANQPLLFGASFSPDVYQILTYYLTVVVILIGLFVMYRITQSPFRNALDAIGQERTRARFIGLPVRRYVWAAFVISGIYGGVAGGLYAVVRQYVRPEGTLFFLRSGDILFMAILGGFRTLVGPLIGGVVLVFLQDVGQDVTQYYEFLTGVVLLILVYGFPRGIVGSLRSGGIVNARLSELRREPSVLSAWGRSAAQSIERKVTEALTSLRIILFGVD